MGGSGGREGERRRERERGEEGEREGEMCSSCTITYLCLLVQLVLQ